MYYCLSLTSGVTFLLPGYNFNKQIKFSIKGKLVYLNGSKKNCENCHWEEIKSGIIHYIRLDSIKNLANEKCFQADSLTSNSESLKQRSRDINDLIVKQNVFAVL